ncbi:MAG: 2-succinyl-6-hydroxy-2,4-cyclohexadiene-carboxylate synthase [Candidatus Hydrogenedentota bacterium]|jgi:2-succinyl-6-hydroxy-2,4-cyclohexadiene-1-carboxylate synthase
MKPGAEWPFEFHGDASQPPLVMLHGFLGCGADWRPIASQLAREHHVLCPDLPGHGGNPLDAPVPFEELVAGLDAFLARHAASGCDLLGYSMGGRLALAHAVAHPGVARRLVLESASPGIDDPSVRESRCVHDDALAAQLASLDSPADLAGWLREWYAEPLWTSLNAHPQLLESVIAARSAASPLALANALRSFSTGRQPSLWGELASLRPPTLLLAGELDHKYTEITERMVDGNPGIARMVVSGCGHNVHLEAPETYTTVLKHFLAG